MAWCAADDRAGRRKKRKETYDGPVIAALARMCEIFDYPCGQRLNVLLEEETGRLRELGELSVSDEVADKLMRKVGRGACPAVPW
jgi:hypothetical protein